jgi:hypothetical protein
MRCIKDQQEELMKNNVQSLSSLNFLLTAPGARGLDDHAHP